MGYAQAKAAYRAAHLKASNFGENYASNTSSHSCGIIIEGCAKIAIANSQFRGCGACGSPPRRSCDLDVEEIDTFFVLGDFVDETAVFPG